MGEALPHVQALTGEELDFELRIRHKGVTGNLGRKRDRLVGALQADTPVDPRVAERMSLPNQLRLCQRVKAELQILPGDDMTAVYRRGLLEARLQILHNTARALHPELAPNFVELLLPNAQPAELEGLVERPFPAVELPPARQHHPEEPNPPPLPEHPPWGILYNRLPNPLVGYLGRLPMIDGSDPFKILDFLEIVLSMETIAAFPLDILLPSTAGPVRQELNNHIHRQGGLLAFQRLILENFVPPRVLRGIQQERFYRPQDRYEPVHLYVQALETQNKVTGLYLPEREVVRNIVEGLNDETLKLLSLTGVPNDCRGLRDLCRTAHNRMYLHPTHTPQLPQTHSHNRDTLCPVPHTVDRRLVDQKRCYGCGKVGHFRSNCWTRRTGTSDRRPKNL